MESGIVTWLRGVVFEERSTLGAPKDHIQLLEEDEEGRMALKSKAPSNKAIDPSRLVTNFSFNTFERSRSCRICSHIS
jgi:hypothetical protein